MSAVLNSRRWYWFPPAKIAHQLLIIWPALTSYWWYILCTFHSKQTRCSSCNNISTYGSLWRNCLWYFAAQPSWWREGLTAVIAMWKKFSFHLGARLRISQEFHLLWFSPSYCMLFFARLLNQSVQCMRSVLVPGEWRVGEVIVFLWRISLLWISLLCDSWQDCRALHSPHGLSVSI